MPTTRSSGTHACMGACVCVSVMGDSTWKMNDERGIRHRIFDSDYTNKSIYCIFSVRLVSWHHRAFSGRRSACIWFTIECDVSHLCCVCVWLSLSRAQCWLISHNFFFVRPKPWQTIKIKRLMAHLDDFDVMWSPCLSESDRCAHWRE